MEAGLAAEVERKKLRRSVGSAGTALLMLSAIITIDTLGAVSSYGAQAFTWLIIMAVFFLLPYGLITAELGTAFPQEGGPYVWVREAFGRRAAAVITVMYWVDNPIWLGGTVAITATATVSAFFVGLSGAGEYIFGILFIWAAVGVVVAALRFGTIVSGIGAVVRVALVAFFCVSLVVYALEHGIHGIAGSSFEPTWLVFLAAAPVLIFDLQGFEVPSNAGEELLNPSRDVPLGVLRAGIVTVLTYGLPVLGILLVLPPGQITSVGGFIDAMKTVFVVYGGHVTRHGPVLTGAGRVLGDLGAAGLVFGLMTAAAAWLIGSDRTQAAAGMDGAAPRSLGHFSARLGTPITVNLTSGVVSTIFLVLSLALTSGNTAKYFSAALGLVISMVTITYVLIFPAVIKLRYSHPNVRRPYRIPGGKLGVWVAGILATAWCVVTTVSILYPGIGTAHPDQSLPPGFSHERLQYELSQLIPLAVMVLVGLLFHRLGARTRHELSERPALMNDVVPAEA
jgi:amino acid transporter